VVRVVPDVAALHKAFDYSVPDELAEHVEVGTAVRVLLHNRRVAGWVVADDVEPPEGVALRPLLSVRGIGPPPSVVALAEWAAWRWAGPLPRLLGTASSPTLVRGLPPPAASTRQVAPDGGSVAATDPAAVLAAATLTVGGTAVARLAPAHDPFALVDTLCRSAEAAVPGAGALVLVPERRRAETLAGRLRRRGHAVAELPEQWAVARRGGVVAIGTRAAAFAPVPVLGAAVVLDAHDEAYHEERAPTWSAWRVVVERARRDGAPCVLVSPCPTLDVLAAGRLVVVPRADERAGWPSVEVVDRRGDDPRTGLYSARLVELVRWAAAEPGRRVLCVLNRTGRARVLACAACGELARCGRCGCPLSQRAPARAAGEGGVLECRRCGEERPQVCASCGSTRLRALRVGVSRVREELEALAGTAVAEVTAEHDAGVAATGAAAAGGDAAVVVGTEAVLHRVGRADAVAFLDFDAELLAPRLRAGEEALALLARAARLVSRDPAAARSTRSAGRLLVQTRQPRHPVVLAAVSADPGVLAGAEEPVRRELGLPPYRAQALVSGPMADAYGRALADAAGLGIEVRGPSDGAWSVLAPDPAVLADLLAAVPRPPGRLRVEVDPVRA
jgi:primosomal protein N' (replication factor Y)